MKGIIIYKTRYGSTKLYAEWLHEATGFDLCDTKRCPRDLSSYDLIILGSSVFAGRLSLAAWIRNNWSALQGKTLLLFLTHMREDEQETANVVPQSLPAEIAEKITVFPVGGRYQLEKMSFLNRTMIKMVASAEKNPEVKEELLTDRDNVRKEDLQALLDEIHRLQSKEIT